MISKYNSQQFWDKLIEKNKTVKGKIFLNEPITKNTVFVHSIIFNQKTGLENVWIPIPDTKMMIGYLKYCFLPEAYERWYDGREGCVSESAIPTLEKVVRRMERNKAKYKYELENIKQQISRINKLWDLNYEKRPRELSRFCREFNKVWTGDNEKFLFLKTFCNVNELEDFIIYTESVLSCDNMEELIGYSEEDLHDICINAPYDNIKSDLLKKILIEGLSDVV